ncbi:MAG TPA: M48 family metallopeptidase, partial [Blastocatellia bacterium]|nr:M48 family metallopeptidase [Blastocatellia bacterium]
MKMDFKSHKFVGWLLCVALIMPFSACRFGRSNDADHKQSAHFKPGFNLLSPQQDIALGQKSAGQVEHEMPLLNDSETERYITTLGTKLAVKAPGEKFPYQFKVINAREINAFALPGGFMYVNRGTIEAARNEAELASVMAHEIAHVALRHGTSQLSKQIVAEKGLEIAASIFGSGSGGSISDQVLGTAGSAGVGLLFLRFSRTMEKQADLVGAEILAAAGYDPRAMPEFFKVLEEQEKKSGGSIPQILSDHPSSGNRVEYLNELIPTLKVSPNAIKNSQEFEKIHAHLKGLNPAKVNQLSRAKSGENDGSKGPMVHPPAPSTETKNVRAADGSFELAIPKNWEPITEGSEMIFAPDGAAAQVDGQLNVTHGMFVGTADLPDEARDLETATEAYVSAQLRGNPGLRVIDAPRQTTIGGHQAIMTTIGGESPVTGRQERDVICTVVLPNGK